MVVLLCTGFVYSQLHSKGISKLQTSNDAQYYTDEIGNVFIYVNIMGHVKLPGTYLVSEGADFMTILAQAGGPLPGAKLDDAVILHKDSGKTEINLEAYFNTGEALNITIKPNDTIYIEQSLGSYLFSKSNIINSALQLMNIYLTISRTN
mgnify:CR=1 FL=1